MLEVAHLSKNYGPKLAVDDISFSVKKGEIVAFLGPNGAGKTTTMRMVTGYLPPSAGEVRVDGIPLRQKPIEAKRRIGYLPELPPVYPEMTVSDYLGFVARLKQVPAREIKPRIERACERCALGDVRQRVIGRLSKGYRQRVGLAQAILHEPGLLILDEPTAGLDPRQSNETRELIRRLAGDHTVILSTHILTEASQVCERVIIINRGQLVAVDSPENLAHRVKNTDTLAIEAKGPAEAIRRALEAVPGVAAVAARAGGGEVAHFQVEAKGGDVREALARAVVGGGWGLLELKPVELSLEEIFLKLTAAPAPPAAAAAPSA